MIVVPPQDFPKFATALKNPEGRREAVTPKTYRDRLGNSNLATGWKLKVSFLNPSKRLRHSL